MTPSRDTPHTDELACIIVTYNPEMQVFSDLVSQLLKAGASIYVVDNRFSDAATARMRDAMLAHPGRIAFIPLDRNYGIAKAINIGVTAARADGRELAMLFDQDSVPEDGLIDEMLSVARRLSSDDERAAVIGPRLYDPRSDAYFRFARFAWGMWKKTGCKCGNGELIPCEFINSSGSLILLKHWDAIGPFREDFFIDHVETEWDMRVRHLGLRCYGYCSKSRLIHRMGDDVSRYWFGRWRSMPRRSPARHYTIIRNAIWMWRMRHVPFAWIPNSLLKTGFTLAYFSLFDREGKSQFRFILRGIRDGLFSRPGGARDIRKNIDPSV